MGAVNSPEPVKLFCAVMYPPGAETDAALDAVKARYGPVEHAYGPIPFAFSEYYEEEMGAELQKSYMIFEKPVSRDEIVAVKLFTNGIEAEHARDGKRTVNLDPGYLARDKLVLATTKDFFHRIYLSEGIYAEVTLHFRQGVFRHFSWTYADYKEPGLQEFLSKARAKLVGEMRKDG